MLSGAGAVWSYPGEPQSVVCFLSKRAEGEQP